MNNFCTVAEAARELNTTPRTIQRWCEAGRFPNARRLNPDAERSPYLIPARDLDALKAELQAQKTPE